MARRWDPYNKEWINESEGKSHDADAKLAVEKGMSKSLGDIAKEQKANKSSAPTKLTGLAAAAEANKKKRTGGDLGAAMAKKGGSY